MDADTKAPDKRPDQNPIIGDNPSDTIGRVISALQWLSITDGDTEDEPIESIKFGRYLLGECCIDALKAAEYDLDRERAAAKTKQEVSHG